MVPISYLSPLFLFESSSLGQFHLQEGKRTGELLNTRSLKGADCGQECLTFTKVNQLLLVF